MALNQHMSSGGLYEPHFDLKTPPSWDPAYNTRYSFKRYKTAVIKWCAATEVAEVRRGPLLALHLKGTARLFAD